MKRVYIGHSREIDFVKELYAPLKGILDVEFVFPHEEGNEVLNSKELIRKCDLFLAEVSYPSTGLGIEIGRAESFNIPVVAIYKKGSKISSSLNFITSTILEYDDLKDDVDKIKKVIDEIL